MINTVEELQKMLLKLSVKEGRFFPKEFMQKHKMYQIGSWNIEILCVTERTDQFREGEVLYVKEGYDIYNPEDRKSGSFGKAVYNSFWSSSSSKSAPQEESTEMKRHRVLAAMTKRMN